MSQPFDLDRFVTAQDAVLADVTRELSGGQKRTHWMWFVFPQIAGLGHSPTARHYAIASLAEAQAYLQHPVLGPRLIEHTALATRIQGRSARSIFGSPDDMKFRSSMTLFAQASANTPLASPVPFQAALDRFFGGEPDPATLERLGQA